MSIVIAYSPCINQGFNLERHTHETKDAVDCGFWPLYIYNPSLDTLELDSNFQPEKYFDFLKKERRFNQTIENGKSQLLEQQKQQAIEDYNFLKNFKNNN